MCLPNWLPTSQFSLPPIFYTQHTCDAELLSNYLRLLLAVILRLVLIT